MSAAYDGDLARVAEARAVARTFVRQTQAVFGRPVDVQDQQTVQLVVSELVTNACRTHQAAACSP
ncbi:hypothetical protein ABT317_17915 [Streptomyces carpinensis]|uniref:ATP-binding protein n=1 Tax=Streptomyces carpinensis TaxID=66369 RepID=A0ABV1W3Q3_9ACTN